MNHEDFPTVPVRYRNAGGEVKLMENLPRPDEEFVALVARELSGAKKRCKEMRLSKRKCKSCGVSVDLKTEGCPGCFQRHYQRYKVGRENLHIPAVCKGCGCPMDQRTKGCHNCNSRFYMRNTLARRKTTV